MIAADFSARPPRSPSAACSALASRGCSAAPIRETDHFWFRLAPEGPYIDSQRDHKAFGFGDGKIFLSEDNGKTWAHSAAFPDAENITFSCILKNGNILFATREKLFLSTDNLKTHRQIIVKNREGGDYLPHTPQNPDQPGWYFHPLDGVHTWDIDGSEMLVWGNYCNVLGGPVPVNIYYSTDSGQTVKIAYSFGRNPHFQEKGTEPESYLGDPDNPVICRHIHSVVFNPASEHSMPAPGTSIADTAMNATGCAASMTRGPTNGTGRCWCPSTRTRVTSPAASTSSMDSSTGLRTRTVPSCPTRNTTAAFSAAIRRISPIPTKHTLLFDAEFEMANMIIEDGVILAGHCAPASTYATGIAISPDLGKTWAEYDLAEFGPRSPVRFHPKNSDGWFRVDLRKGWIERGEVLFIKPKA